MPSFPSPAASLTGKTQRKHSASTAPLLLLLKLRAGVVVLPPLQQHFVPLLLNLQELLSLLSPPGLQVSVPLAVGEDATPHSSTSRTHNGPCEHNGKTVRRSNTADSSNTTPVHCQGKTSCAHSAQHNDNADQSANRARIASHAATAPVQTGADNTHRSLRNRSSTVEWASARRPSAAWETVGGRGSSTDTGANIAHTHALNAPFETNPGTPDKNMEKTTAGVEPTTRV